MFGEPGTKELKIISSSDPVDYSFAGYSYDVVSGNYETQTRHYDPNTGTFLSQDPIGLAGGKNIYAYVGNSPLTHTDPFGLDTYQLGASISGTGFGFSGSAGLGLAVDSKGNIGFYGSYSIGVGVGEGFTFGGQYQQSNANNVCDLRGPFTTASIGAGSGAGGSAEFFNGYGSQGQPVSGTGFTIGAGAGAGGSLTYGPTSIPFVFSP
jgi:RHS repeat-associated protein